MKKPIEHLLQLAMSLPQNTSILSRRLKTVSF